MQIIVAGSRGIKKYLTVETCIEKAIKEYGFHFTKLISGAARGVDTLGETWALKNGVEIDSHPAKWNLYGISAGFKRNAEMAETADALIAIRLEGKSNGTDHMISCAKEKGLKVLVFNIEKISEDILNVNLC